MTNVFTADALKDQVVFITGASRGIGAAILDACLAAGATVVGTATSESGAARITEKIAQAGGKGEGVVLNVTDTEQSEKVLTDAAAKYGSVSVLVNNAGITRDGLAMRMKDDQCHARHDEGSLRPHHQYRERCGFDGQCRSGKLRRRQSRCRRPHARIGS